MTTSVGRVLADRYQIDEVLGRGGMATVWRGRDLRLDRAVAIKELAGPWLADHCALRQFDREARMAARLAHPNIVAIHDVDVHDGAPFIVMELIEGATVAQLLADGPLAIEAVVAIAAQVCDGLAAAHAAGVIHRDIKPANLMVTDTGVAKICDFGIARGLLGAPDPTVSGPLVAIGTSKYMAPEQASGGSVDARADLYALGCTLYAMLAGTPPFHGTVPEVLAQQQFQAPVPLRTHRVEAPVPLEELVMRLLAKDPGRRPGCAHINAVLADLAADATPALLPIPAGAKVASAAVPAIGRGVVPAPTQPRLRAGNGWARVIRYGLFAAVGLAAVLISAAAAWRMAPHQAGNPLVAPVASSTPSVSAMPATSSPPSSSAPAPTRAVQATQVVSPSAPPSSQAPPSDPIAALRLAIQQQVSTGNLNPDKASALYPKVDAIAHAAYAGNPSDEAKAIKAFKDSLLPLRTGGQLSVAGYEVLSDAADAISATLP